MPNESLEPEPSLRERSFLLFWFSRVFSAFGSQMAVVAVGWFIYDHTRSAYDLGFLGLVQVLPMLVLTFVVGHVADRMDRRKIVLTCQIIEAGIMALLTIAAALGALTTPIIFAAMAVMGAARTFEHPTLSALLPSLVPQSILHRAIAVSSSAMQTAAILGPALGGLLYGVGVAVPLGLCAGLFFTAGICMAFIRMERFVPSREPVTLKSFFLGISFVWTRSIVLGVISLDLFAVLLGGVTALLPIFARDILHAGPWGLGLLRAAPAVGALAMSVVLTKTSMGRNVGLKMFAAIVVFGIGTLVFSASDNLTISLIALLVLGASDNVNVVIRSSLVQLATPEQMRGRVNAVNSLFIGASNQLGEFESGMTAGLLGPVGAGILGGVGTILVALIWAGLFPALRKLHTLADAAEPGV